MPPEKVGSLSGSRMQRLDRRAEPFRVGAGGEMRGDGAEDVAAMEGVRDVAGAEELGLVELPRLGEALVLDDLR